jgi:3-hydroxyisobutyrate dehydrogenase-like beta-hydroxyacid dehydrogenase
MTGSMTERSCTVGILYPGEMGSSLGRLLAAGGFRVVTTLEGRGARTCRLCRDAGLEVLESLSQVVHASDIVISLVSPAAAVDVAEHFCDCAHLTSRPPVFVDANSISPNTAKEIFRMVSRARCRFVDASIHGLAARLQHQGTMYLSGRSGQAIAELFAPVVRTRFLGEAPGTASAMKMLMAGMSKGLVALFLEMGVAARQLGLLDELIAGYREYYPGIMTALDRLVPTYPQHAARRGEEMNELERMLLFMSLLPNMISGARQAITEVGQLQLADHKIDSHTTEWSVAEVVEAIHQLGGFRATLEDPDDFEGEGLAVGQALA